MKFCQGFWRRFLWKNMEEIRVTLCVTDNYAMPILVLESA